MKGEMNDAAGKVWTYLASFPNNQWVQDSSIIKHLHSHPLTEIIEALIFWAQEEEVEWKVVNDFSCYRIKDLSCPPNTPECATYAEYQRSLRSQRTSKRQSATRSARKNGSAKRGSPRPRKDV